MIVVSEESLFKIHKTVAILIIIYIGRVLIDVNLILLVKLFNELLLPMLYNEHCINFY